MEETIAPAVTWITLAVAGVLAIAGLICCVFGRRSASGVGFLQSLGIAFISSSSIAAAVLSLQLIVQDASEEADKAEEARTEAQQREEARIARRDNYQLVVSLTSDLTGFDPQGHPACAEGTRRRGGDVDLPCIEGISFSGKTLENAHLDKIYLRGFDFQDAILRRSHLAGANLSGANLVGADLSQSNLTGTDFSDAHLESARFDNAVVEGVGSLRGAHVNAQTCWPQGFGPIAQGAGLISEDGSLGYVCVEGPSTRIEAQPVA